MIFRSKEGKLKTRRVGTKAIADGYGLKVEVVGAPDSEAKMLLMNHKSMLDVLFMEIFYPNDLCWVAKRELGNTPFFGLLLKLPKMILVDREDKKELVRLVKECGERLEDGRVIAIFPEGTRNKHDAFLHFKAGAKIIAEKHKLKIQPAVMINTRKIFDGKRIDPKVGAKIVYLESFVPQKDTDWYEELREKMQRVHDEHSNDISNR